MGGAAAVATRQAAMDEPTSDRFGSQAMTIREYNAERLLEAGVSVLLESNFHAD